MEVDFHNVLKKKQLFFLSGDVKGHCAYEEFPFPLWQHWQMKVISGGMKRSQINTLKINWLQSRFCLVFFFSQIQSQVIVELHHWKHRLKWNLDRAPWLLWNPYFNAYFYLAVIVLIPVQIQEKTAIQYKLQIYWDKRRTRMKWV